MVLNKGLQENSMAIGSAVNANSCCRSGDANSQSLRLEAPDSKQTLSHKTSLRFIRVLLLRLECHVSLEHYRG